MTAPCGILSDISYNNHTAYRREQLTPQSNEQTTRIPMKQVYRITYPTGKIYIGKDSIGSARYMGSPDMNLVNADFKALPDHIRRDYTLRKEILWESESATEAELSAKEVEMIRLYRSNDPAIGYNRWPKPSIRDGDEKHSSMKPNQPLA